MSNKQTIDALPRKFQRSLVVVLDGKAFDFDVTVDYDRIIREIGPKAIRNARNKSTEVRGGVVVEYIGPAVGTQRHGA